MDEIIYNNNQKIVDIITNISKYDVDYIYETTAINGNDIYDPAEMPNEFTSGYYLRCSEVIIIAFIILFWLWALRKFTRNFDKIRTTHYREIPYKYKIKDVENAKSLEADSNQKEGDIFTKDPINNLITESKLYPYDIISNLNTTRSSIFSLNYAEQSSRGDGGISKNIANVSSKNKRMKFISNRHESIHTYNDSSFESKCESLKKQSNFCHSLMDLSQTKYSGMNRNRFVDRIDDSILNDNIYRTRRDKVKRQRRGSAMSHISNSFKSKKEKHHLNISPFIRRSFLDLHAHAIEHTTHNYASISNISN